MASLRKRGKVWYVYRYANGKQRAESLRTTSKSVANKFLKAFEYKLAKKQLGQATDVSVGRLAREYFEHSKSMENAAPTTATTFRGPRALSIGQAGRGQERIRHFRKTRPRLSSCSKRRCVGRDREK